MPQTKITTSRSFASSTVLVSLSTMAARVGLLVFVVASACSVVRAASATAQFYEYENCTTAIGPVFSMSRKCLDYSGV
jgi:hypothetical protein